jgi:cobalt-zinc-cadmium efflux system protein
MSAHHQHSDRDTHSHQHTVTSYGHVFAIGVTLNMLIVIAEWTFGIYANSLSLVADAAHNLGDVLGLVLAWGAMRLAQGIPTPQFTYGLRSSTVLASLTNAITLLLVTGALGWEGVQRLTQPEIINEPVVIMVAVAGMLVNGFTAWLFVAGSKSDLNMRGAYLHLAADASISASVAIGGTLIMFTGWAWVDPLLTLVVAIAIIASTWKLLKQSLYLALQAVPDNIDSAAVKNYLNNLDGVTQVHDLHIWAVSTSENALTAHLIRPCGHPGDVVLQQVAHTLSKQFGIHHTTLQIELSDANIACEQAPDHVL